MCAATFGELPACLLAKFPTCLSILLGNSQHVHDFLADVPNMCTDFLGEFPTCACVLGGKFESPMSTGFLGKFQMSIDILGYFSHDQLFCGSRRIQQMHHVFFGNMSIVYRFSGLRYLTCASVLRASQVASIGCNCLWFDKKTVILHRKPRAGKNVKPVTHHHILLVRRSWMNPLPRLGAVCAEPNHATRCFSLASAS